VPRVARCSSTDAQALHLLAIAAARQNWLEAAVRLFAKALALAPDDPAVLYDQGIALASLKRREEAFASYDRAVALRPDYPEAWNNRGIVLAASPGPAA